MTTERGSHGMKHCQKFLSVKPVLPRPAINGSGVRKKTPTGFLRQCLLITRELLEVPNQQELQAVHVNSRTGKS